MSHLTRNRILNVDTAELLAVALDPQGVADWWRKGMNSTRYAPIGVDVDGTVRVSERLAALDLVRELRENPGIVMVSQGSAHLKLEADGRTYRMHVDEFRGAVHTLDAASTTPERLMQHWLGFVASYREAEARRRERVPDAGLRMTLWGAA